MLFSSQMDEGFNPRPRVGGDKDVEVSVNRIHGFQSTPPRRGRQVKPKTKGKSNRKFQSTPPRRGRPDPTVNVYH